MKTSLQLKFTISALILILLGFSSTTISLIYFYNYKNESTKLLSGDQRLTLSGILLESKVKALDAMLESTVYNEEGNELYRSKLKEILDEYYNISEKNIKDSAIEDSKQSPADGFVSYRNIKTTVFNMYRESWQNKWMTIAHTMGQILNDMDNMPYTKGDKVVLSIMPKLNQLIQFVGQSLLSNTTKLDIINRINGIKSELQKFNDGFEKSQKILVVRKNLLKLLSDNIKIYNEKQSKHFQGFLNGSHNGFLFALLFCCSIFIIALMSFYFSSKKHYELIKSTSANWLKQFGSWIGPTGTPHSNEIIKENTTPVEWSEVYDLTDQVIKKVNQLRKEDLVIKKSVSQPFVLINKSQRKAVYWNSAFSLLAKTRSSEEMGATAYSNLVRFTDVQGKVLDIVEKCIIEDKEVVQLALTKIGSDQVATQVTCLPVSANNQDEHDYIYLQIRDLRDENKRLESELDRQLENIRIATECIKNRAPLNAPASGTRKSVHDVMKALTDIISEIRDSDSMRRYEIEKLWKYLEKEGTLKQNLKSKLDEFKNEISKIISNIADLKVGIERVKNSAGEVRSEDLRLQNQYHQIESSSKQLTTVIESTKSKLSQTLVEFEKIENIASTVLNGDKSIRQLLQKATLLNLNNSIIESKVKGSGSANISPENLMMITDNLNQIMFQFSKTYQMVHTSIDEIKKIYSISGTKIKNNIKLSSDIIHQNSEFIIDVENIAAEVDQHRQAVVALETRLESFELEVDKTIKNIASIDLKNDKLIQISEICNQLNEKIGGNLDQLEANTVLSQSNT